MNDRIQRALDGELPADQLSPHEAAELRRYQTALSLTLRQLDSLDEIDVAPEVLNRIAKLEQAPAGRSSAWDVFVNGVRWFWSPQPVALTLRPAFGLAAAAVLAAVLLLGTASLRPTRPAPAVAAAPAERILVQFRLGATDAREVALVGDFNAWQPEHHLFEISAGVWSVVIALAPGVYDYGFVIDGETWRLDPLAPQVADGFGGASSRVAVLPPERAI